MKELAILNEELGHMRRKSRRSGAEIVEEWCDNVIKDCKDFLRRRAIVYRGMEREMALGEKQVRKDRKPRDSSKIQDQLMNTILKGLGLPTRDKVLFSTTEVGQAKFYGHPYRIFPAGKLKFYSFGVSSDLYYKTEPYIQLLADIDMDKIKSLDELRAKAQEADATQDLKDDFEDMLFELSDTINTSTFPRSGEISFDVDKYYYMNDDFEAVLKYYRLDKDRHGDTIDKLLMIYNL